MHVLDEFEKGYFGLASVERAKHWLIQKHPSVHKEMMTLGGESFTVTLVAHDEQFLLHIIKRYGLTDRDDPTLLAVVAAAEINKTWRGSDDRAVPRPTEMLESHERIVAQRLIYDWVTTDDRQSTATHAIVYVQVGADMVACEAGHDIKEPKIIDVDFEHSEAAIEGKKQALAYAEANLNPGLYDRINLQQKFETVMSDGATLWDEGEVTFSVDGVPYQHGARILSQRDTTLMRVTDGFQATHFRLQTPNSSPDKFPSFIFKMLDAPNQPDGITLLTMIVPIDSSIIWPRLGQFLGTSIFKAAETAFLERATQMNQQGIFRQCILQLSMGLDMKLWSFIGRGWLPDEPIIDDVAIPDSEAMPLGALSFAGFNGLTLEEQPKHLMFGNDGRFHGAISHLEHYASTRNANEEMAAELAKQDAFQLIRCGYPDTEPWVLPEDANKTFHDHIPAGQRPDEKERKGWRIILASNTTEKALYQCIVCVAPPSDGIRPEGTFGKRCPEFQDASKAMTTLVNAFAHKDMIDDKDFTLVIRISLDNFFYKLVDGFQLKPYTADELFRFDKKYNLYR